MKPRILSYLTLLLTLLSGPASAASNGPAAAVNGRYVLKSEVEEHMRFSMMELLRRYPDPAEREKEFTQTNFAPSRAMSGWKLGKLVAIIEASSIAIALSEASPMTRKLIAMR